MRYLGIFSALLIFVAVWARADTCGDVLAPCELPDGEYYAALPDQPRGAPVAVFLHGYGSSGKAAVRNKASAERYTNRGYALIAPTGQRDPEERFRTDWAVDDGFKMPRDDVAFLRAVIEDAVRRFGVDRDRVLLMGFSRGGSMVWDAACADPDLAAAYAAVAGGFWEPIQKDCAAPVHLFHTHGFNDGQVPLEGRAVTFGGIDFVQGNILKGLDTWRRENGCEGRAANSTEGDWIKRWDDCENGSISLRLTTGGHGLPKGWAMDMLDWFEGIKNEG
ncbi:MAG: PHB depolymerase family esterase [Arenibacterium sp.]